MKVENSVACDRDDSIEDKKERENKTLYELEEHIPPDLERYIRVSTYVNSILFIFQIYNS